LSIIVISPDFDIILDAENKVVGEARSDVAVLDITPLEKKVSELEALVDELVNLLKPKGALVAGSIRRYDRYDRGESMRLGVLFLKHMAIGSLIGLALFCLIMLIHHAPLFSVIVKGVATLFKPL